MIRLWHYFTQLVPAMNCTSAQCLLASSMKTLNEEGNPVGNESNIL